VERGPSNRRPLFLGLRSIRRIRYVMLSNGGENCGELWIVALPWYVCCDYGRTYKGFYWEGEAGFLRLILIFPHASKEEPGLSGQPDIGGPRSVQTGPDRQLRPSPALKLQRE
jgi:hypothetical protein